MKNSLLVCLNHSFEIFYISLAVTINKIVFQSEIITCIKLKEIYLESQLLKAQPALRYDSSCKISKLVHKLSNKVNHHTRNIIEL